MIDYMNNYMEYIKTILKKEDINESIKKDFIEHMQFMQHERLIHLLVTMLFALLLMFGFIIMLIYFSWILVVFTAIIFIVEIFYIFHYYKLENGVQKMYRVYDELGN
ncbi:MAG: hypothetical protein UR96_C0027G0005 [candidate division WS6 bacterium GW2011_GWC1_36_11]|uniref:Uncharacterized protein n=2 Tax=Candidatus Dojkabacteria TaxID=74243 RepID=A0A0G0DC09_9BACT|nr:MAG: hypothetical protein UR96_C0027G0005 [candidate division WS6 bacterium GW2011_GWC1_36_11]KKQ03163.1 MAG: hypothetical protein US14_C0038G0003 [candidate division WS6 bacterium GW2011_WS6_36_26]KKQ17944.1 MAG: hypothetical protein US29_C0002G0004 [candidate division WS6 bacterium GW2011_GWF1_36_8]HAM37347.1 hypothetical protein [Patescibacteria group bacterium]